jgi:polar amino acid transport system permease protein
VFLVYEKEVFMGNFDLKVKKFLEIFIAQNGYVKVVEGLQNTIMIAVLGLLIGIVIGTIIAAVRVMPKYKVLPRVLNAVCSFYVGLFRGTPMVVQLLVFYYVMLPLMGIRISGLEVAILVFGLNSGAYISEIMRGGILSVDGGQMEAGRAVGLGYWVTMIKIVIPQAVKNILPTLGNEFIALIKETSVVSFVGAADLYVAFNYIGSNSYEFMVPYLVMAMIYIILVLIISAGIKIMERSLRKSDRRN